MFKRQVVEMAVVDFWHVLYHPSEQNKFTEDKTELDRNKYRTAGINAELCLAFSVHSTRIARTPFLEYCSTTLSIAKIASMVAE
jgi:hypothetical protein